MLTERSQTQKATSCIIPVQWHSRNGKIMGIWNRAVVTGAEDGKKRGLFFEVDETLLHLDCTGGYMTVCVSQNS